MASSLSWTMIRPASKIKTAAGATIAKRNRTIWRLWRVTRMRRNCQSFYGFSVQAVVTKLSGQCHLLTASLVAEKAKLDVMSGEKCPSISNFRNTWGLLMGDGGQGCGSSLASLDWSPLAVSSSRFFGLLPAGRLSGSRFRYSIEMHGRCGQTSKGAPGGAVFPRFDSTCYRAAKLGSPDACRTTLEYKIVTKRKIQEYVRTARYGASVTGGGVWRPRTPSKRAGQAAPQPDEQLSLTQRHGPRRKMGIWSGNPT